jgi:hypothetical protein
MMAAVLLGLPQRMEFYSAGKGGIAIPYNFFV